MYFMLPKGPYSRKCLQEDEMAEMSFLGGILASLADIRDNGHVTCCINPFMFLYKVTIQALAYLRALFV